MILVFDLDDTLYNEQSYVKSGFMAVAIHGYNRFGWSVKDSYHFMQYSLETNGRGSIFDSWISSQGKFSKKLVRECIGVYRTHTPSIQLSKEAGRLLPELFNSYPLYLVTDGNKIVQKKKIESLRIERWFKKAMITHRYGIKNAKPSIHCFKLIKKLEKCEWTDIVYIGDNPRKDFINLNKKGALTIRIMQGAYAAETAQPGFDGKIKIESLDEIPEILSNLRFFKNENQNQSA